METTNVVLTKYGFDRCLGAFFQMSTKNARALLPNHLQPVEIQHERSVLAVLAFQFTESEVGAYDELVMAIITPPRVQADEPLPKAAFFPFMVATSTAESRAHAIERWHLPHYMKDLDFSFREDGEAATLDVSDAGEPVLSLTVTAHVFAPAVNPYHAFTVAERTNQPYKVNIFMEAPHAAHEEERGRLVLHEHPLTAPLNVDEVDPVPFREEWYREGVQTFEELEAYGRT
jgi:hypothetical protein